MAVAQLLVAAGATIDATDKVSRVSWDFTPCNQFPSLEFHPIILNDNTLFIVPIIHL